MSTQIKGEDLILVQPKNQTPPIRLEITNMTDTSLFAGDFRFESQNGKRYIVWDKGIPEGIATVQAKMQGHKQSVSYIKVKQFSANDIAFFERLRQERE